MINWKRVEELKSEIGEEDFAEVAELFLDEVKEVLKRLKSTPVESELEQDMHFLKSSSLNLGLAQFSNVCSDYEKSAARGNYADIQLSVLFSTFNASEIEFAAAH